MNSDAVQPPQNPAGEFAPGGEFTDAVRSGLIAVIEQAPEALDTAVAGLSREQLDVKYRNWTIRQIAQHLADSHIHSYIRFKWTLTEETPTIKAYDENRWSALADARTGDVAAPLAMYRGVHQCWTALLRSMTPEQFERRFHHPESGKDVILRDALAYYAWHARHHTAQITWLRERHGW